MGESIVEPPMVEDKMRGSVENCGSPLEVSVSFGRFESDSLSWEKWSSFSPNKYLEEVEKCATPGSVAQKKAYFEAHYKKIAARKIEEMEKQNEAMFSSKDDQNGEGDDEKAYEHDGQEKKRDSFQIDSHFVESNKSFQKGEHVVEKPYEYDVQAKHLDRFQTSSNFDESNESSTITINSQCSMNDEIVDSRSSVIIETKEEMVCEPNSPDLSKKEESVLVKEENQVTGFQEEADVAPAVVEEKMESRKSLEKKIGNNRENGNGKMGLGALKKSPKMAHLDKPKTLTATKKKPIPSSPTIFAETSTPKTLKPTPISSMATPSRFSTKKINSSSLQKNKNIAENKKITPLSPNTSLRLGPVNDCSPSLPIDRRSLIMEKMGDKDIVKRAFKSFQNSFNQGRASEDPTLSVHNKVTTSMVDRKESSMTHGIRRGGGKMDVQRNQLGRSLNSTINGSIKGVSMDQRRAKPAPSSFGVKSDEKRKDIFKKPVEQSSAKELERARPGSKSKEVEAEMKKLRQELNFKATPMPSFYRGHDASKSSSTKEGERRRKPENAPMRG